MAERKLLMIPGPIEITPSVASACSGAPPSHTSPLVIDRFGYALQRMRDVWMASEEHLPMAVAGSGTLAMEIAATNVVEPGDRVLVVNTGYFSDRMTTMLERRGAKVTTVGAPIGQAPSCEEVASALDGHRALFATHVDTSTGVRVDLKALAAIATRAGALSVFDAVCSLGAEQIEQASWGADVVLTGSQKAIGMPAGLALMMVSPVALAARRSLNVPPPMSMDWLEWLPVATAYQAGRAAYFSTPATTLVVGLATALDEILCSGDPTEAMRTRFAMHQRTADAMRAAWRHLGLHLLPHDDLAANTLSAIRYPGGIEPGLVQKVAARGVSIAGGLHPDCKAEYFRVGHMGYSATQPDHLELTVHAIAASLAESGHECSAGSALQALYETLEQPL